MTSPALLDMPGFRVKARDHADVDVRRDENGMPYLRQGESVVYLSNASIPVIVEALQRLAQGKEVVPVIYLPRRAPASDLVAQAET